MEVVEGRATIDDVDAFLARLGDVGTECGCIVQAFDARYVVGRTHLERAVELADRARERAGAIAEDHAVEVLLYAAGRRQINRALEMGVSEGDCPVVVVVHPSADSEESDEARAVASVERLLEPAATLEHYDEQRVRTFFDVSERESAATDSDLATLVGERVALLTIEK